ncbi:MAG: glycosyltransferase family 39 protein [Anaerolineae bacterium]
MRSSKRRGLPELLVFLTLLAFALRLCSLDAQSFWSDEGLSVRYALQDVRAMLKTLSSGFQSPLYFLSLHWWLGLAGRSDFALRFPSAWFSALAVPLVYALGRALFGRRVGALAALAMALNPFLIRYAQEARMYAMVLCLSLASSLLFIIALRQEGRRWSSWGGYALVTAACIYTHYYAFLILFIEWLYFVFSWARERRRETLYGWLAAQGMIALLYLPWLPSALRLAGAKGWQEPTPPLAFLWELLASYSLGQALLPPWQAILPAGFILLLFLGLYVACKRWGGNAQFLLIHLFVPILFGLGMTLSGRGVLIKYLMVLAPVLCLAVGLALDFLWKWKKLAALPALLFVLITSTYALRNYYFDARFHNPDFRGLAEYLEIFGQPGDGILFDGPDPEVVFWHYYRGELPIYRAPSPVDLENSLYPVAARHARLWVVLYFHQPGPVEFWLARHGFRASREEFSGINLYLYSLPDPSTWPPEERPGQARSSGQVEIAGYRLFPQQARSGEVVNLALRWRAVGEIPGDYKVSLRLKDGEGHLIFQDDRWPLEGFSPTSSWTPGTEMWDNYGLPLPPGTLPGEYEVEVLMYDPAAWREEAWAIFGPISIKEAMKFSPGAWHFRSAREADFGLVELLACEPLLEKVRAGETLTFFLYWRAAEDVGEDYEALVGLQDKDGKLQSQARLPHRAYPASRWRAGELLRVPYDLKIDPATPPGRYLLTLNLIGEDGNLLRSAPLPLRELEVAGREHLFTQPPIQHPQRARLGEGFTFLGYGLEREEIRPGENIHLTLYWKAGGGSTDVSYTVFTHLLDKEGRVVGQKDSLPQSGEAPTTGWLAGEIIVDRYEIPVGEQVSPGEYFLEIGMYEAQSGERLPAFSESGERLPQDCILLDRPVTVRK